MPFSSNILKGVQMMRGAGILLPVTSLPSPYGVGTLGKAARDFVDFLCKSGQTYWQILPICPTGYGDSPYQSVSSYAGNPYMIDLDELSEAGLLKPEEYQEIHWGDDERKVDYALLYNNRFEVLRMAAGRIEGRLYEQFEAFCGEQKDWLEDYALYMAIKSKEEGRPWQQWPDEVRLRKPEALEALKNELQSEVLFWKQVQFLFFEQWAKLKAYANEHHIKIIGDLPIYVSEDSSDVWSNPKQFWLDENLTPVKVAGVPPDAYSEDGQLWGNPIYNWEYMKQDGYSWWIRRIAYQSKIYDVLRFDHFRGFDQYYAVPYGEKTARGGEWLDGPGIDFFRTIEASLGKLPAIAEDLGYLTSSVLKLLEDTGFPGMKVLVFAFDSRDTGFGYKPHCYTRNCVVYTGTHDNDTVLGWFETALPEDIKKTIAYFGLTEAEGYGKGLIRAAWASVADTAIIPFADLLGQGSEGRINTPSTTGDNWTYRCMAQDFTEDMAKELREAMELYERI